MAAPLTVRIVVAGGMVQRVECDHPDVVRCILVDHDMNDIADENARELDGKVIMCCDYPVDDLAYDGAMPEELERPEQ